MMRKIAIVGLITLCGLGACAQGVVTFTPVETFYGLDAQVYSPNPGAPAVEEQGNTVAQNEATGNGTSGVTYAGTPIGGSSYTGATPVSFSGLVTSVYTYGNLFTAELYALSTTTSQAIPPGTTLSSLSPVTQYQSTFCTTPIQPGPGYFNEAVVPLPDPGIPGTGYIGNISSIGTRTAQTGPAYLGNNAAAAVVAWFNGGGQFSTLAAAQAAGVPWGQSAIIEITGLGEPTSVMTQDNNGNPTPPQFAAFLEGTSDGAYTYLQSFSLIDSPESSAGQVPEPSTIALALIGASAFLSRRHFRSSGEHTRPRVQSTAPRR
jgi:hypothetical protein